MRARLVAVSVALSVLGGISTTASATAAGDAVAVAAKSCAPGYVHAGSKCLHAGQYCSPGTNYRKWGFKCVRSGGKYRLRRS